MKTTNQFFTEREIQFQIKDITLSGTLTIPDNGEKSPVLILLSGYGPCERDFEGRGLKKFRIISSYLAKEGIATLRYDDRGSGKSSPVKWSDYTFHDLAEEVLGIIRVLEQQNTIDSTRIGILGFSLGAAIAPIVASQSNSVKFLILIGPHGLIGVKTGVITRKYIGRSLGENDEESTKGANFVETVYNQILAGDDWEEISYLIWDNVTERYLNVPSEAKTEFTSVEKFIKFTYEEFLISEGNTPMFRSFLRYDPRKSLSKVLCPSFLLFAELDIFHPPDHHMEIILETLERGSNTNIDFKVFSQTTHEFTTSDSRKTNEFNPDFLLTISDWLLETCSKV